MEDVRILTLKSIYIIRISAFLSAENAGPDSQKKMLNGREK